MHSSTLPSTSALDGGWVVNATDRPLYPLLRPGTHCIRGWVGPRAGLDWSGKSRPLSGFDPRTVQLVRSHYTDWAIPAPIYIYVCVCNQNRHVSIHLLVPNVAAVHTSPLYKYSERSQRSTLQYNNYVSQLLQSIVPFCQYYYVDMSIYFYDNNWTIHVASLPYNWIAANWNGKS